MEKAKDEASPESTAPQVAKPGSAITQRKVITTASIEIKVESTKKTKIRIEQLDKKLGGYISNSSLSLVVDSNVLSIQLRVPLKNYEKAMEELRKLGNVISENVDTQDVTEEFIDIESKIKNLKVEEASFREVLKKATDISEILQIEQELARVRGEIDSMTGRLRFLSDQVDLSTINITLREKVNIVSAPDAWDVPSVFKMAVKSLLKTVRAITYLAIYLVVFSPIILVLLLLARSSLRRYKKNDKSE